MFFENFKLSENNIFSVKLAPYYSIYPQNKIKIKKKIKGFNLQLLSRQLCSLSLSTKPGNGSELRIINQGDLLQDSG
jgi:hypothetical protein